ncbi:MAG: helix-turn-helix domain-containing GNAT family N-acetyltransferase [Tannerella sp.]|jgi:DNA-binding MarR family transcriptional regulator/predicted GNAT family N-acyltransferase|nr:helix-turn-helix domain-containing GNAT family N-acetyltransferase [Tannerella sp.]
MNFFNKTGKMAIGSRLRMLTDRITDDAARIYKLYGIDLKVKWFPVFFVLSDGEPKTITAIAKEIGHSHPSVSNIIREMSTEGIIKEKKDKSDGRRNMIVLSAKGKSIAKRMPDQYADVVAAIESISGQTKHDLWKAIEEWEFLLSEKSLLKRVEDEKKARESMSVRIVPYDSRYREVFRTLNEEWIKSYFEMEEADHKALDDPEGYILQNGGHIFVALYKDEPVGVCALLKMNDGYYDFELAKMAVSPKVQGKNIGFLLGRYAINKAKEFGATKVYLESNTILKPAISLYQKLGFKKVAGHATPYKRSNIQMELLLT